MHETVLTTANQTFNTYPQLSEVEADLKGRPGMYQSLMLDLVEETLETMTGLALRRAIFSLSELSSEQALHAFVDQPEGGRLFHPHLGDFYVAEVSARYVAAGANVSVGTAHRALVLLWQLVDCYKMPPPMAMQMGVKMREKKKGSLWGTVHVLKAEAKKAIDAVAALMVKREMIPEFKKPNYSELTEQELARIGFIPMPQVHETGSQHRCVCPFHPDTIPSMVVHYNENGKSGAAHCFGCCEYSGDPVNAFWVTTTTGQRFIRPAKGTTTTAHKSSIRSVTLQGVHPKQSGMKSPGAQPLGKPDPCRSKPSTMHEYEGRLPTGLLHMYYRPVYMTGSHGGNWVTSKYMDGDPWRALAWSSRNMSKDRRDAMSASAVMKSLMELTNVQKEKLMPGKFMSVSVMKPYELDAVQLPNGWGMTRPLRSAAYEQEWVLFDIDNMISGDPYCGWEQIAEKIQRVFTGDKMCSGKVGVVRTSTTGVQVWVQLENRYDANAFFEDPSMLAWYTSCSDSIMKIIHGAYMGGHMDFTAFAAGRWGRKPGWRLLDSGDPFNVHVIGMFDNGQNIGVSEVMKTTSMRVLRETCLQSK